VSGGGRRGAGGTGEGGVLDLDEPVEGDDRQGRVSRLVAKMSSAVANVERRRQQQQQQQQQQQPAALQACTPEELRAALAAAM
jgi:hypothetical protein